MTLTELDTKISEVQNQLAHPTTHPTEVYTRIVGYYRSLVNWNRGKREEYDHRLTFAADSQLSNQKNLQQWLFFQRATCPSCPALKARLPELGIAGQTIDLDSPDGYRLAEDWAVLTTPTLILLDADGSELGRVHQPRDLAPWLKAASPA